MTGYMKHVCSSVLKCFNPYSSRYHISRSLPTTFDHSHSNMFPFIRSLAYMAAVTACPQHEFNQNRNTLNKRAGGTQDWTYEASYNWGMINASTSSLFLIHTQLTLPVRLHTLPNRHESIANYAHDHPRALPKPYPLLHRWIHHTSVRHTLQLGLRSSILDEQHSYHFRSLYDI